MLSAKKIKYSIGAIVAIAIVYQLCSIIWTVESPGYEMIVSENNSYSTFFKRNIALKTRVDYFYQKDTISVYVLNDSVRIAVVKNENIPSVGINGITHSTEERIDLDMHIAYTGIAIGDSKILISPKKGKHVGLLLNKNNVAVVDTNSVGNYRGIIKNYIGEFSLKIDDVTFMKYETGSKNSMVTIAFFSKNGSCYIMLIQQSVLDKNSYVNEIVNF